jgi:hypothetical protein
MLNTIMLLLEKLESEKPNMPPTVLYNEGWLLRVVLQWFFQNQVADHPFSFKTGAGWFSEGLLSSPFLAARRGDPLAESYTHADGVIGNIAVGGAGKGDICLIEPFEQFVVLEAKLFSKLAGGTTRVAGYNQAARNVACMAKVIELSGASIDSFNSLGFYVITPQSQLDKEPSFNEFIQKESLYQKVLARVESYKARSDYAEKRDWLEIFFIPVLSKLNVEAISWEMIIEYIGRHDQVMGDKLVSFYSRCLDFNNLKEGKRS